MNRRVKNRLLTRIFEREKTKNMKKRLFMKRRSPDIVLFSALLLSLFFHSSAEVSVQAAVEHLLGSRNFPLPTVGIAIKELERDSMLSAINADSMVNPASVLKLLTATVAFEQLGLGSNFSTRVFADSIKNNERPDNGKESLYQGRRRPGLYCRKDMALCGASPPLRHRKNFRRHRSR